MSTTTTEVQAQGSSSMESGTSTVSSIRAIKRKLSDAIQSLDLAISSPSSSLSMVEGPPPPKRHHLSHSFYSTLAKYGVKSRPEPRSSSSPVFGDTIDLSESAPHLTAILARTASRSSQTTAHPFKCPSAPPVHEASEYRPSSTQFLLSRLATYKLSTYANKPSQIDAVAAAKCGWINDGKDRLVCGMCGVSWVLAAPGDMSKEAANALVAKQRVYLVEMHKDGCPWKTRQCDDSVYRVPLQSPSVMARNLRSTALALESTASNIAIKHPITPSQLDSLRATLSTIDTQAPGPTQGDPSALQVDAEPSDTSLIIALFGWIPVPPPTLRERRGTSTLSASYLGTLGPSVSAPPTPPLSRVSSVSGSFKDIDGGSPKLRRIGSSISQLQLSASPLRPRPSSRSSDASVGITTSARPAIAAKKDVSLVHCLLCQRRVGLWSFASQDGQMASAFSDGDSLSASVVATRSTKVFDLVKEHRSYCPYVVRSTIVPSLPPVTAVSPETPDRGLVEGWRAALTVVQRCGLGQRQRLARFTANRAGAERGRDEGLDGVETMVAGVKVKGGRELLSYVRGLLG